MSKTGGRSTLADRIVLLWLPLFLPIPTHTLPPTWYCPVTNCGGVNISYPFRVLPSPTSSNAVPFCGYRDLNVTCDSSPVSLPTLQTKVGDYAVNAFDGDKSTLTVLHPDASIGTGNACPVVRRNFTLQTAGLHILEYGGEVVNLTFFYNCSRESRDFIPEEHRIGCLDIHGIGGRLGIYSYVFIDTAVNPTYGELYSKCLTQVLAPVMRPAVDGKGLSQVFGDALQGGFQLRWGKSNDRRCEWCEQSDGYCGGGDSRVAWDDDLICFCQNGSAVRETCHSRSGYLCICSATTVWTIHPEWWTTVAWDRSHGSREETPFLRST